jgi:hypothetical protein
MNITIDTIPPPMNGWISNAHNLGPVPFWFWIFIGILVGFPILMCFIEAFQNARRNSR